MFRYLTLGLIVFGAQAEAPGFEPAEPMTAYFSGASTEDAENADVRFTSISSSFENNLIAGESGAVTGCGCQNGCPTDCCSCEKQKKLAKAVGGAYKGIFADNNFNYLCDPCYDDWRLGENLKRNCLGDCVSWDVGGQFRLRHQSERNIRGLGLTGVDDDFLLTRLRLYANVEYSDWFRFYGEMIDANSNYEDFGPRPIEENRADILNLFIDARLFSGYRGDLWGRVGRQEMLYGAQRLISPLDWANTRRTFEGGKLFWQGENWTVDGFWTRPVPDTLANSKTHNKADQSQEYMGVYASYLNLETEYLDVYWTRYLETDGAGFEFDTFGVRWGGSRCDWLWEVEAAAQFGEVAGRNSDGGFYSLGVGHKFSQFCWTPTFWAYYDWASGEDAGPAGSAATGRGYNHQFPLAHKYMGFMDLYGRRNLEDLNFLATVQPTKKLKFLMWYHIFHMQNNDVPYNAAAVSPIGMTLFYVHFHCGMLVLKFGRFMAVAEEVSIAKLQRRVGATMQVLVDHAPAMGKKGGRGRSYADAPEIDGVVHLLPPEKISKQLKVGEFTKARIVGTQGHDLVAVPV